MECVRVRGRTAESGQPGYDAATLAAAKAANNTAHKASDDAAFALTKIQPTTISGVSALLTYVDAFNSGAFYLEPNGDDAIPDFASAPYCWPRVSGEDDIDMFGYALLDNVRRATAAMQ
jgi:hypothetical protein